MGNVHFYPSDLWERLAVAERLVDDSQFEAADAIYREACNTEVSHLASLKYATFLFECRSAQHAIQFLETELDRFSGRTSALEFASLCNLIGKFHRECENDSLASFYQQRAIAAELKQTGSAVLRAETRLGKAEDLLRSGELEPARFLLQSLLIATDPIALEAKLNLADCYRRMEEWQAATRLLKEVISDSRAENIPRLLVRTLELLSLAAFQLGDYRTSQAAMDRAMVLAQTSARCVRDRNRVMHVKRGLNQVLKLLLQSPAWN